MLFTKISQASTLCLLDKFCPLGQVPSVDAKSVTFSDTTARKFALDSGHVKVLPRSRLLSQPDAYNPKYVCFGVLEALSTVIQDDWDLYSYLFNLVQDVDREVAKYVASCEQAALVVSHRSFGDELFPHIHQQGLKPSLSVFLNLTSNAPSTLCVYPPLADSDKAYRKGYTQHKYLLANIRHKETTKVEIPGEGLNAYLFDAAHTPHSYTYSDDLWFTFLYDQVTLTKPMRNDHVFPIS